MLSSLSLKILNALLAANPVSQQQVKSLRNLVIALNLPGAGSLKFTIAASGKLVASTTIPNCTITIPLASASHLVHGNSVKTFKMLKISGNPTIAHTLLSALANIKPAKMLYQHDSLLLGIAGLQLAKTLQSLINYSQLVVANTSLSLSQYLQYETNMITDQYRLTEFYNQVDKLTERTALLAKRIQLLKAKL